MARTVKSVNHKSLLDIRMGKENTATETTLAEEREILAEKAMKHEASVAENKARFTGAFKQAPQVFKPQFNDHDTIVKNAEVVLKKYIKSNLGAGGVEIDLEEFKPVETHDSYTDSTKYTDKALVAFACKFGLPGTSNTRTARLVVAYDEKADDKYTLETKFFDLNDQEYELRVANLTTFLAGRDEMKSAEKPLAYFNAEIGAYDVVETSEPTSVVVARLQSEGIEVVPTWIDTCHNPEKFGRVCHLAKIPASKTESFLKIANMSEEEWYNRADEDNRDAREKMQDLDKTEVWYDRAAEKGNYKKPNFDKPENWYNRGGEDVNNAKNPYNTEVKQLFAGGKKKVDAKDEKVGSEKTEAKKCEKCECDPCSCKVACSASKIESDILTELAGIDSLFTSKK